MDIFEASFLKHSMNDNFFYSEIEDFASNELADVMKIPPMPISTATTNIKFDVDVSAFGVYAYEAHHAIMCGFNCINICVDSDFVMIINVSCNCKVVFKFNSTTNVYIE